MSNNGKKPVSRRNGKHSDSDDEEEIDFPTLPASHENYQFDLVKDLKENQLRDVESLKQHRWMDRALTAHGHDNAMGGLISSLPGGVVQSINNSIDNEFPCTDVALSPGQRERRKKAERLMHNNQFLQARQDFVGQGIEGMIPQLVGLLLLTDNPPIALDNFVRQVQAFIYHTTQLTQFGHGPDEQDYGKGSGHPSKKRKGDRK